jgi:hypothetical protein
MKPLRLVLGSVAAVLLAVLTTLLLPVEPAAAAPTPTPELGDVQVTVLSLSRSTPVAGPKPTPLSVQLKLTNTSDQELANLRVAGARGDPINTQQALDAALADPQPPDPSLVGSFTSKHEVRATLPAGASTTVTYTSSTSMAGVEAGMCLCQNRIYPLYFTVHYQPKGGPDIVLGTAQTVVPSFTPDAPPQPTGVSWVWPILEPPHRVLSDTVFTDDSLATSVSVGRLDRLLRVVEEVGPHVPLTVLIDPELLDELAVMADGDYRVTTSGDRTTDGTGTEAARSWLERLRQVLGDDPLVQLAVTPYADPDVESLTQHGLGWADSLPDAARARVDEALGGHVPLRTLAWPADSTLSQATLDELDRRGVSTVLVDDRTLPGGKGAPTELARLRTAAGTVTAAITSTPLQQYVGTVVGTGGTGLASLPELIAEIAIRAVADGSTPHYVALAPPRDVDPDPAAASRAILDTSRSSWARPVPLLDAAHQVRASGHGRLTPQDDGGLPPITISTAHYAVSALPLLTGMVADKGDAAKAFGAVPQAVQRSESSAWRDHPKQSSAIASTVRSRLDHLVHGVHLVRPSSGSYTFGSSDSPLPITIANTLDVPVNVRVSISTVGGVVGFTADDIGMREIDAHSKLPLHVPAHTDPVRRIKVQVQLLNQDGVPLGDPIVLSVRSTALGAVGKIITFAAAGLLAVALLLRLYRRWRRSRRQRGAPPMTGAEARP